jgi:hypothetical protein
MVPFPRAPDASSTKFNVAARMRQKTNMNIILIVIGR